MSSYKCSSNHDSLVNQFKGLQVHNHKNKQRVLTPPQPKRVIKQYYNAAYKYVYAETHEGCHFETSQTDYNIIDITDQSEYEEEYVQIEDLFWKTNSHDIYGISSIQRIENPYLLMSYLLKKEELKKRNNHSYKEKLMFHGTTEEGANDICRFNFDWRRCGMNTGHKFGQGVSFSPSMIYASDYPERNGYNSVMLVARVLVGTTCVGNRNMVLPKDSLYQYDNSVKPDNRVYVNYEDNSFYPAYKIYYGTDIEDDNEYRYLKRKALNKDKRRRY